MASHLRRDDSNTAHSLSTQFMLTHPHL